MQSLKLAIIGHGMVSQRLIEKLIASEGHPYTEIHVFSAESATAYNRILLSSVLAGDAELEAISLQPLKWFSDHGVTVHTDCAVVAVDPEGRTLVTADGQTQKWDQLVFATGSRPAQLGLPGEDLKGVQSFRDIRDTEELIARSRYQRRAVVIGGGFLGLEAAEGLRQRGMQISVVHRSDWLLNRQLDRKAANLLEAVLRDRGTQVYTGRSPSKLLGNDVVEAVELADGTRIDTDLVVIATGITPNVELARSCGIACNKGILVDSRLRTNLPNVFAIGECVQFGEQTFGLVDPVYQQADVLARHLRGETADFCPGAVATRLKISGIPIFSCGRNQAGSDTESVVWEDSHLGHYSHLILKNNRLEGAILVGETRDGPWYFEQLLSGRDLSSTRSSLAFGAAYCDA